MWHVSLAAQQKHPAGTHLLRQVRTHCPHDSVESAIGATMRLPGYDHRHAKTCMTVFFCNTTPAYVNFFDGFFGAVLDYLAAAA